MHPDLHLRDYHDRLAAAERARRRHRARALRPPGPARRLTARRLRALADPPDPAPRRT